MANLSNINNVLRVSSDLRVGINTDAASYALEIGGTNSGIKLKNSGGSGKVYSLLSDTSGKFQIYDDAAASGRLVILSGGDVGIGTDSPSKKLQVQGSAPWIRIQENSASSKRLDLYVDPSTAIAYIAANQSAQQLSFQTSSLDRIRILNNGNVGIGTDSPDEKLDVAGKVQVTGTSLTVINASDPVITVSDTDTNYRGSMRWLSSSNVLEFFTRYGGTYYTNNLVLDRGNVGIGTASPNRKLTVQSGSYSFPSGIDNNSFFTIAQNSWSGMTLLASTTTGSFIDFGDTDAGWRGRILYGHNGDYMYFSTAATERMRIADTLITVPTVTEIRGDIGSNKFAIGNMGDASSQMMVSSRGFLTFNVSNTGSALDATERMRIDSSGNVGIGVTPFAHSLSTSATLDLKGNGGIWGYAGATYVNSNAYYNSGWKYKSTGEAAALQVGGSSNTLTFRQAASGTTDAGITYTEAFRVHTNGNVGIGTSSPESKLSIDYTAAEPPTSGTTSNSAVQVTSSLNNQLNLGLNTASGSYGAYIQVSDNNLAVPYPLNLQPNGGKVGIGETSPTSQLHIKNTSGDNRGILVDNTVAASYAEVSVKSNLREFRLGTGGSGTNNPRAQDMFYIYDATTGGTAGHRFEIRSDGQLGSTVYKSSGGSADTLYTTLNNEIAGHNGNGMKYLGQLNIRDGSRYLDVALNTASNNIMFYIYVKGYLYNRGMYISCKGGYTYSGSIINVFGGDILDSGIAKDLNVYRGTNSTAGNYSGNLCFRIDSGSNGYSEGMIEIYLGTHSTSLQNALKIHSYAQNDTSNYYFAQ